MTAAFVTRIELDDRGIAWIAGTKVKVNELAVRLSDAEFRRRLASLKRSC